MQFVVQPIGTVHNSRQITAGTDHWGAVTSTITVDPRFGDDCLLGLADFSHVDVLFVFDQATEPSDYRPHPARGRADLPPVGIFAGRGPDRPNRIGVTACPIISVRGRELEVLGLDAVSGTPVIDLKPAMTEFQPTGVRQPAWASQLMSRYFLP